MGKLINQSNNNELQYELADTFFKRFIGLMGRKELAQNAGLLFVLDKASKIDAGIHMFFMRIDIAVIWLSEDLMVVDKVYAKKWFPSYFPQQKAKYFLETHPCQLDKFEIGDKVAI